MGLADKRARVAVEKWLPDRTAELNEINGGGATVYEVDWESFDGDAKGLEWLEHNGPQQIAMACREIAVDDVGKEALRDGVSRVVLRNVATPDDKALAFDGGVFELSCAFAQSPKGRFNHKEIKACLEGGI